MSKDLDHALEIFAEAQGVDRVKLVVSPEGFIMAVPIMKNKINEPLIILRSFLVEFFSVVKDITFFKGSVKDQDSKKVFRLRVTQSWTVEDFMSESVRKKTFEAAKEFYKALKKLKTKTFFSYQLASPSGIDFKAIATHGGLTVRIMRAYQLNDKIDALTIVYDLALSKK